MPSSGIPNPEPGTRNPEPGTLNPAPGAAAPRIRCGVAGTGSLGQHHARIYASLPSAELAGIYDTNDARAAEICARYACRRCATLEELGEVCDAVSVAVPTAPSFQGAVMESAFLRAPPHVPSAGEKAAP